GGTGLGLSIARDFIDLHGGWISVSDAPGGGALFQLEVPLKAPTGKHVRIPAPTEEGGLSAEAIGQGTLDELMPTRAAARPQGAASAAPADQPTILVVEDNHELNGFIAEHLAPAFRVAQAFDGAEGLRLAGEVMPDLIITDLMMPAMSGSQMIGKLRQERRFDRIPVLVLSAKADDALRIKLLEHDAQDYVVKPFSAQELVARARNLVAMKRSQEQLEVAVGQLEAQSRNKSDQLVQSEQRFRLMVESVRDYAIFMLSSGGKVASWNLGAERLTGYSEAEVLGRDVSAFYTEDDRRRGRPAANLEAAAQHGQYAEDCIRVRKDGSAYYAQVTISRISDGDGGSDRFVKVIRDVNERRLAEEALKKSESKLKWLIDSNTIGVIQYRYDGTVTESNDALLRMLGFTREEFDRDGLSWRERTPPEWTVADMNGMEQLRARGVMSPFEKEFCRKDGSRAAVMVGAANFEWSRDEGIAYVLDVSELKKAELALKESEAKFRTIANAMPQMVWSTQPDGYPDYYNDRWYEFTGMPESSTDGEEWNGMFHPEDQQRAWDVWRHSLETGEPYEIEYRLRHRSGQYRWTLGRALPVRNESGEIVRWMGTCTDIHEQKIAQEALRQSDRRKDEFLAMLAHELRNPLAPIMAAADLLAVGKPDEKKLRAISEVICRQTEHMTGLIEDLLDVSRVTRGLVTIEKEPVDVKSVVTEAVEQARPFIENKRHHLALHIASQPATVSGDKKRLVQVLTNILNNAAKYTPEGGRIRLDLEVDEHNVTLAIRDNGVGMTPELAARAFDLFAQGARTSDRSLGGLGIGLALVRSLVHLHGGTVVARSDGPGKGCELVVSLPCLHGNSARAAQQSAPAATHENARRLRVMIVDDNVDATQMLALLLESSGYEVLVGHHPRSAIELARIGRPDVCLLDIGLPEMDGYELAQRLRLLPGLQSTRFVALTGYGQPKDHDLSMAAGFATHFVKPIDAQTLLGWLAGIDA
ncbi:MAG TPA: PAS domain S-box protein, partial [Burkholderiales bacterium]|nr:PAS domain S-box protein [Burkholderiales bacterium]